MMIITGSINKVRQIIKQAKQHDETIGFVPTMGALHCGHLSLVRKARKDCDFVVVSIFVNPVQFGAGEDYRRYPRPFEKDKRMLEIEKVDLLFCPSSTEMYPEGYSTYVDEVYLSKVLCGIFRPDHFKGVCTIVTKLLNIIAPDIAYFGQKDYQQALILKKITVDLNFSVKIKVLPIVREKGGLALSSRNAYLDPSGEISARCLYAALQSAKPLIDKGQRDPRKVIKAMRKKISAIKTVKIDYIKIVNAHNLRDLKKIEGKVLIALAVFVGKIRLIDNVILHAV